MKLEKLSSEQIKKTEEVKKFWLDYIFSCKNQTDRTQAKIQIDWLYKFCKLDSPILIFVDSPMGCQFAVQYLKYFFKNTDQVRAQVGAQVGAQVWAQVGAQVGDQVWAQVGDQVRDQVGAQVGDQVWDQVWAQVGAQVGDQVWAQVGDQVGDQHELFCSYGSVSDYGWVSFFDFFTQIGVINHEQYKEFKSLLSSGIYDMIQLNGFCIVSNMPSKINRNQRNRMHCEDGPAIQFRDGYELYYWNGICVPKQWITDKNSITKQTILEEKNAEKRRCLREILGVEKYFELLGGVNEVDKDTDDQGNEMILFESKKADEIINKKIQFLSVICPSTGRKYLLYPPNQQSGNVWEAKASTFRNEKVQYRHGDVALLNTKQSYEKPIVES